MAVNGIQQACREKLTNFKHFSYSNRIEYLAPAALSKKRLKSKSRTTVTYPTAAR